MRRWRLVTVVGDTCFVWLMIAGGPAAAASGGYGPTAGTGGAAGGGPGGSWNSWNMPQNGPPPGTQPPPQPPQSNSSQPNSNSNPSGPQGESSCSVKPESNKFSVYFTLFLSSFHRLTRPTKKNHYIIKLPRSTVKPKFDRPKIGKINWDISIIQTNKIKYA